MSRAEEEQAVELEEGSASGHSEKSAVESQEEPLTKHEKTYSPEKALAWSARRLDIVYYVLGALIAITGAVQLILTQLTVGATFNANTGVGSQVNIIISSNGAWSNFVFSQYPIDIYTGTACLVVGVLLIVAGYYAPMFTAHNYQNNNMTLRTFIGAVAVTVATFYMGQARRFTSLIH